MFCIQMRFFSVLFNLQKKKTNNAIGFLSHSASEQCIYFQNFKLENWTFLTSDLFNPSPSPPGLLAHPWVPGGGGAYHAPLISREPLVVESRARRHSKDLHKTHQKHVIGRFPTDVPAFSKGSHWWGQLTVTPAPNTDKCPPRRIRYQGSVALTHPETDLFPQSFVAVVNL